MSQPARYTESLAVHTFCAQVPRLPGLRRGLALCRLPPTRKPLRAGGTSSVCFTCVWSCIAADVDKINSRTVGALRVYHQLWTVRRVILMRLGLPKTSSSLLKEKCLLKCLCGEECAVYHGTSPRACINPRLIDPPSAGCRLTKYRTRISVLRRAIRRWTPSSWVKLSLTTSTIAPSTTCSKRSGCVFIIAYKISLPLIWEATVLISTDTHSIMHDKSMDIPVFVTLMLFYAYGLPDLTRTSRRAWTARSTSATGTRTRRCPTAARASTKVRSHACPCYLMQDVGTGDHVARAWCIRRWILRSLLCSVSHGAGATGSELQKNKANVAYSPLQCSPGNCFHCLGGQWCFAGADVNNGVCTPPKTDCIKLGTSSHMVYTDLDMYIYTYI